MLLKAKLLAMKSIVYYILFFVLFLPGFVSAQQTQVYRSTDVIYRSAVDLFEKQKYVLAQDEFDKIIATAANKNDLFVVDAAYYSSLCALELFHKDAEIRLKQFLADYPESPQCRKVKFQLGRYNYRKKKYGLAIEWFRQVEIYDLKTEELAEYYFKRGYAHYELGHIDSAKTDFYEIKELDVKYSAPATYYYSHISYLQESYETAVQGFLKLSTNETFGPIVPYYIAQIYFLQARYEDVIAYAPPLLDSAKRASEIAQLIGASYYRTARYKEAIPFLEKHYNKTNTFSRDDAYELGYAHYKVDSCNAAKEYFQQAIADSSDAISQNSWYHLADCYLKTDNKLQSRNAFVKASKMNFDPVIREDALFNSARLSYELDFSPFNEAIVALNEYLREFPHTPRHDEAYTLLTNVYLSSKNYKEALAAIEKLKTISPPMQPAYQKVAYNRGIELYKNKNYDNALICFDKALIFPINSELNAQAHYWKAETWYGKAASDSTCYQNSISEFLLFQIIPGATTLPNYNTADYNIGYCYFQQKKWESSMLAFRKYLVNKTADDTNEKIFDANLRLGDGYFRLKDFLNSAEFYEKAIVVKTKDSHFKDYAMYQQAMALGIQGKKKEKADLLKKLRENYPNSNFLASSRFEEARTLHDLRLYDQAFEAYSSLYASNQKGKYAISCLQNMGLIYRAKNDPDNALIQYKKAVEMVKGKGTDDFKNLLIGIKELYLEKGQLEQWENYASMVGYSESQSVADSTLYVVAQRAYSVGKSADALVQLNKYIQKFPMGIYITDINYMRAECSFKNNDLPGALESYVAVLSKGQTKYVERCLTQSAFIYYKQADYRNASIMYLRIENEIANTDVQNNARVNLMRSFIFRKDMDSASIYAGKVVTILRLTNEIYGQAHYLLGKAALNRNDRGEAEKQFKDTEKAVPNTEYAAESRYSLCLIKYNNKEYKATEKALLKEINDYAGFSLWSGRGWLLLADNYLAMKDTFQAKYVLQNYVDNGDLQELIQLAKEKLNLIEAAQQHRLLRKEQDLIIPIDNLNDKNGYEIEPINKGGVQ